MGTRAMPSLHNAHHWPQLADNGLCTKRVRREAESTSLRPCGKGRDDDVHLYYPCLNDVCVRRFWSIESRLIHWEKSHRGIRG